MVNFLNKYQSSCRWLILQVNVKKVSLNESVKKENDWNQLGLFK